MGLGYKNKYYESMMPLYMCYDLLRISDVLWQQGGGAFKQIQKAFSCDTLFTKRVSM